MMFRSTPPRRRPPLAFAILIPFFWFRSTPPRRRRPLCNTYDLNIREVSIHASAQEATTWIRRDDEAIQVSIHASAQEATGTLRRPFQQDQRSEEHTSELQSLMRISYAVFCLKK